MTWLLLAALTSPFLGDAHADSFQLANGSVIEGTLATYELGGNCQIFVASGAVRGATLLLPCEEILAFSRPGAETPAPAVSVAPLVPPLAAPIPATLPAEPVAAPAPLVVPVEAPVEAPAATAPYTASLPEGYTLPGDDAIAADFGSDLPEPAVEELAAPLAPPPSNLRGTPRAAPRMDDADLDAADAGNDSADAVDDDAAAAPQAQPDGWRKKEQKGGMPRWLHRAIYGDEPAPADTNDSSDDSSGDDGNDEGQDS